jgi:DNA-directed RNA polymerase subunit N (RpoN/RPB10)
MAAEAWAAFVAKLADQRREEDSADEAQQAGCRRVRISAVEVA